MRSSVCASVGGPLRQIKPGRGWKGHIPGQYVRIGIDVDGVRLWRAYSQTSGPRPDGLLSVTVKAIPVHIDPPLHREYKRLINVWFTTAAVAGYEERTRALVTQLIDAFIDVRRGKH